MLVICVEIVQILTLISLKSFTPRYKRDSWFPMISQNGEAGGKWEPQIRCSHSCHSISSTLAFLDFNISDEWAKNV